MRVSLQCQVKALKIKDKLVKQNSQGDRSKVFEPITKSIKDTFQGVLETLTETSIENNKALSNLNDKLLKIINDRGMLASYLVSFLSKITNLERISQFKLVNDPDSNKVKGLLVNKTLPVSLCNNLLTFRDTDIYLDLGDLLKMITNKNYNVDLANFSDKKIMFNFAKDMNFDEKSLGEKALVIHFLKDNFHHLLSCRTSQKQGFLKTKKGTQDFHLPTLINFVKD